MDRLPTADIVWGSCLQDRNLSAWVKSCATLEQPRMPHLNGNGSSLDGDEDGDDDVRPRRMSSGGIEG